MSTNEEAIALLMRRRAVFERLCTARDATHKRTAERMRLESVCEKCADRLMAIANSVVESNATRHEILTSLSPGVPVRRRVSKNSYVYKWKRRLTHELEILEAALRHLSQAKNFLTVAAGDVFAGVPILRTRLDLEVLNKYRKGNNDGMPSIQESHAEIAAAYIQTAREVCTYVRREIPASVPLQLAKLPAIYGLYIDVELNNNEPKKALDTVRKVLANVRKYEIKAKEQLAILAAADAEMDCLLLSARENAINDALAIPDSRNNTISFSMSMSLSMEISMSAPASIERRPQQSFGNITTNSNSNSNIPSSCDSIAKLDMKRALELLIALTQE